MNLKPWLITCLHVCPACHLKVIHILCFLKCLWYLYVSCHWFAVFAWSYTLFYFVFYFMYECSVHVIKLEQWSHTVPACSSRSHFYLHSYNSCFVKYAVIKSLEFIHVSDCTYVTTNYMYFIDHEEVLVVIAALFLYTCSAFICSTMQNKITFTYFQLVIKAHMNWTTTCMVDNGHAMQVYISVCMV